MAESKEYVIRAAGADRCWQEFMVGSFPLGVPDLKDGAPWRLNREKPDEGR
jgi:hypothetical protein